MAPNTFPDPEKMTPLVGNRYELTGLLASGGMGEVYEARDTVLDRRVAVKILHRHLGSDAEFVARFRQEATSAARLSHPNIVAVYDWGEGASAYMVMEYVDGQNLRQILSARGPLPAGVAAGVALGVCAALDAARRAGIVHRDIKPENILIRRDGVVKVADFGVARALAESRSTQAGLVMGTAAYLAPEQVEGTTTDHRADLYSLGIVLWEMLAGRVPFDGDNPAAVAYRRLADDVPALPASAKASPAIRDVVARATARRREDRFPSAAEMTEALRLAEPDASTLDLTDLAQKTMALPIGNAETVAIVGQGQRGPAKPRRRRRWIPLAALLLVAAMVPIGMRFFGKITVPSVVGSTQKAAESALKNAGLGTATTTLANDAKIVAGHVISQHPPAGDHVRRGTGTRLVISLGPELVAVPSVVGKAAADATKALQTAGFVPKTQTAFSATIAKGKVIAQKPEPPLSIAKGSTVTITVSNGPEQVAVPNVIGMLEADATSQLKGLGFSSVAQHQNSDTVETGKVISTNPAAGAKANKGSTVTIVVSSGPTIFIMPDVRGMTYDEAAAQLKKSGLKAARRQVPGSYGDTVVSSVPRAGAKVHKNETVILYTA